MSYDAREACAALARTFPSLEGAPGLQEGVYPDLLALDAWAATLDRWDGQREAVQFVLHLFDGSREWACGRFHLRGAVTCWDDEHKAAFAAWARHPVVF